MTVSLFCNELYPLRGAPVSLPEETGVLWRLEEEAVVAFWKGGLRRDELLRRGSRQ